MSYKTSEVKGSSFATGNYFNTPEYLEYLRLHCSPAQQDAIGRVAGLDLALQILKLADIAPQDKVLEIGCGVGRILHLLRTAFGAEVYGSDVSQAAIAEIKKSFPDMADCVYATVGDTLNFAEHRQFDRVITWGVFELTNQRQTLIEMSRVLKLGGMALLCSVKNHHYHPDDKDSVAAHQAYVEKHIPINFTEVGELEMLISYLGMKIKQRIVFEYKKDVVAGLFSIDQGGNRPFAEAMYLIEKVDETPLDNLVYVIPA